jgi:hypothetical protein
MQPEPRYQDIQDDVLAVIELAEDRGIDLSRLATARAQQVIDQLLAEIHGPIPDPGGRARAEQLIFRIRQFLAGEPDAERVFELDRELDAIAVRLDQGQVLDRDLGWLLDTCWVLEAEWGHPPTVLGLAPATARLGWARGADVPLTLTEMGGLLGAHHAGPGAVVRRGLDESDDGGVGNKVKDPGRVTNFITDKYHARQTWGEAQRLFPYPSGKPRLKGVALYSGQGGAAVAANVLVTTWKNPVNAMARRRAIYYHVIPRMLELGRPVYRPIYRLEVAFDDWSPRFHEALTRRLGRHGADWCWIRNFESRGLGIYFSNVALDGFQLLDGEAAVKAAFADALKAIRYPVDSPPQRFRPFTGSRSWSLGADSLEGEDQDRWQIIAVKDRDAQGRGETDFNQVDIEAHVQGWETDVVPPYWRFQWGRGLKIEELDAGAAAQFFAALGYHLTKYGALVAGLAGAAVGGVP